MVDFRYLRAFALAAKHLNFSKAAAELRISPSALSRQISLLESGSGLELFIRNTRHVTLTGPGKKLFASLERFEKDVSEDRANSILKIGCLQSVFEFVLADVMEQHPKHFEGQLEITIGTPESLERTAAAGDLDLILTNLLPPTGSNFHGVKLFRERMSWIGNGVGNSATRPIVFSAFEQHYPQDSLNSRNRIRVNSFNATVEMAKRKIGRAIVALPPKLHSETPTYGKQWIYAITPRHKVRQNRVGRIVKLIRQHAGA